MEKPKRIPMKDLGLEKCSAHGCSHYVLFRSPVLEGGYAPINFIVCEVEAFNFGRSLMDTATSRDAVKIK